MRGIWIRPGEAMVEPMFWGRERMIRHRHANAPESWSPDGDKQCLRGLDASGEIVESCTNEIVSWQCATIHDQ